MQLGASIASYHRIIVLSASLGSTRDLPEFCFYQATTPAHSRICPQVTLLSILIFKQSREAVKKRSAQLAVATEQEVQIKQLFKEQLLRLEPLFGATTPVVPSGNASSTDSRREAVLLGLISNLVKSPDVDPMAR